MQCRQFTPEQDETTSTVLKTSFPTDVVGVLKQFYSSTPMKGDIFVLTESYRPRVSEYHEDVFTVTSVKRMRNGIFSVNLAGKLKANGNLRDRFPLKLWSVDMPGSENHGTTVVIHAKAPYFLVRKTSPDYEELRPKDFVFPNEAKRDARHHLQIGDVLYRHFNYDQNGRAQYDKHIVKKVTRCFVTLANGTRRKVSYREKTSGLVAYLFDGYQSYHLFKNR